MIEGLHRSAIAVDVAHSMINDCHSCLLGDHFMNSGRKVDVDMGVKENSLVDRK